jgi:hypothetical protein
MREKNKARCSWQKKCGCSKEFRVHRMEEICHRQYQEEAKVLVLLPAERGFLCQYRNREWLQVQGRLTMQQRKINEYKEVRVRISYSNCTVATVHMCSNKVWQSQTFVYSQFPPQHIQTIQHFSIPDHCSQINLAWLFLWICPYSSFFGPNDRLH